MNDKILKPCPFCGGKATFAVINLEDIAISYYIYCTHCGIETKHSGLVRQLIRNWNRRVNNG